MPQKRKQTPDMPQSPPKRVTRARAKKEVDSKPDTTRIRTASVKATKQKIAAEPIAISKAEAEAEAEAKAKSEPVEEADADLNSDVVMEEPVAEPPKTRGKAKATTTATVKKAVQPSTATTAPSKSTRSRATKTAATASDDAQLPKARGRPKRIPDAQAPMAPETVQGDLEPQLPSKATRGRAAVIAVKPPSTRTRAAAAAPKKKVQFDDQSQQDKENQPLVDGKKKPESKSTSLRAKPIRKPATATRRAKGTKATKKFAKTEDDGSTKDVIPLSPKKITQVAKTPSVGSEDELVRDKSPLRSMSKSPSKIPMSVGRDATATFSTSQPAEVLVPESPKKEASPGRLATSPRKPPPSPYKDALKESPRKLDLGKRPAQPRFDASTSPSKSALKEAPKRVNLGDSQPVLQWSKTPMKSSLMQSPARRPGGSSMKPAFNFSPSKSFPNVPTVDASIASQQASMFKLPSTSVASAVSSPLRAARSPGKPPVVYDLTKSNRWVDQAVTPATSPSKLLENKPLETSPDEKGNKDCLGHQDLVGQADEVAVSQVYATEVEAEQPSAPDREVYPTLPSPEILSTPTDYPGADLQQADEMSCDVKPEPMPLEATKCFVEPAFMLRSSMFEDTVGESESEDELASPQKLASPSPLKAFEIPAKDFGTPIFPGPLNETDVSAKAQRASARRRQRNSVAMTPLAMQMSSWLAASPEKKDVERISHKRGVFSPAKRIFPLGKEQSPGNLALGSPAKPTFFEDEMAVRDEEDAVLVAEGTSIDELQAYHNDDQIEVHGSEDSQASETYGDENAVPEEIVGYVREQQEQEYTLTCTPTKVFDQYSRVVHTVSKVPLRPADDGSPLVIPRKRSRSLAGPLCVINMPDIESIGRDSILSPVLQDRNLSMSMLPEVTNTPTTPETPTAGQSSVFNTPGRSIRKAGYSSVLKGAVVYVDVHTTEGADASGIFVDLLTQMGARCVKQWHWNPQCSLSSTAGNSPKQDPFEEPSTPGGKIGITHVVYKDGGKRTLEKVREAKGAVFCVGVGWVLDCEREDKWLDEGTYAVDTSIVPRGGSRRRKSMEPRALANLNGSLVPAETPIKAPPANISPTKEFLTFDTPTARRETFEFQVEEAPTTPVAEIPFIGEGADEFDSPLSPTTPYYLSKGAKLVQQTCPPKQTQELFFPLTGKIEDQPNEVVRQRLLAARRKSLQWASKVQSPLGRTVSYGK
ncbi:MAG: hypothetical protein Q9208_006046 [Pyrenodesmia sp. 3 TL-2023]